MALMEEYTKQIIPNDLPPIFLCVVWTVCRSFSRAFRSVNATETRAVFLTRLHSGVKHTVYELFVSQLLLYFLLGQQFSTCS